MTKVKRGQLVTIVKGLASAKGQDLSKLSDAEYRQWAKDLFNGNVKPAVDKVTK